MVMATGLGKTLTTFMWALPHLTSGKRLLFLCHSNEILAHANREIQSILPTVATGVFNGTSRETGQQVIFATFQSLSRNLKSFSRDDFHTVIVDESHHSQAQTYLKVIQHFKPSFMLGITATPDRADLEDIREIFGEEVVDISLEQAIAEGWLPDVEYRVLSDGINDSLVEKLVSASKTGGMCVSVDEINKKLFIKHRDSQIAKIIHKHNSKTLVFCQSIHHAEYFQPFLRDSGLYHSQRFPEENQKALAGLKTGKIKRLVCVSALNEGVDVPDVEVVVFLRTTGSSTVFKQQLGRGMRPGKPKLAVLDFVGSIEHVMDIRTMAKNCEKIQNSKVETTDRIKVEGKGFSFNFDHKIADLISALDILRSSRWVEKDYYKTPGEARNAVLSLGITRFSQYQKKRYCDPKLPVSPQEYYGFSSWDEFMGIPQLYSFSEARTAVVQMGIKNSTDYFLKFRDDPRLPAQPHKHYQGKGWVSWPDFTQNPDVYPTFEEARNAARALKVFTINGYVLNYKKDPKLRSKPKNVYPNEWTSWRDYLGMDRKFLTFAEAKKLCKKLGVRTESEYRQIIPGNNLPWHPKKQWREWKGWDDFLDRKQSFYTDFQMVRSILKKDSVTTKEEYLQSIIQKRRSSITKGGVKSAVYYAKFPVNPDIHFSQEWKSWDHFFGKKWSRNGKSFVNGKWVDRVKV